MQSFPRPASERERQGLLGRALSADVVVSAVVRSPLEGPQWAVEELTRVPGHRSQDPPGERRRPPGDGEQTHQPRGVLCSEG